MTATRLPCGSTRPWQCADSLRRSVTAATRWIAIPTVLAVGERASWVAHTVAEHQTSVVSLATGHQPAPTGPRPGDPLLLPTLGLPALSLALVSDYPLHLTEQLLLDLDVFLQPEATVVFLPSRTVPDPTRYDEPAGASAFHRLGAVLLDHVSCAAPTGPQSFLGRSDPRSIALTARRS